jgi:holo-[acyl-carrier protein] synthase
MQRKNKMIVGIGIDLIEVERVKRKIRNRVFQEKIFSPVEIAYCESKPGKAENYAARFAAKEAFLKATGLGLTLGHDLAQLEVTADKWGKPSLKLHGRFKLQSRQKKWKKIHLSLTHLRSVACAVVIIER